MTKDKFFEGVATYKTLAKKEVGQNFLIDADAAERIVSLLEEKENDHVLEIGCGAGSLTYFLSLGPAEALAIDIDEAMLAKTGADFEGNPYVQIKKGNAMKFDYSGFDKIVGNLPYYITSGIIEQVLLGAVKCQKAVFMVQKEAATRILAKPNTKDYSPLSVYISIVSSSKKEFNVGRSSFTPAPHVDSTVISLTFNERHNEAAAKMYRLACSLFLQRRKTIYNNLKNYLHDGDKAKQILDANGISYNARPEELTPEQYWALSNDRNLVE